MNLTTKSLPSIENKTLAWGYQIIDLLVKQGATYFCLSPGSRSTPLASAISAHPEASFLVHFDERGAAFHAFGFAKATGRPAVVVCTSGSAVGNFFPAVMEAALENIPLIILTADRPSELQHCGSNQTCDQVKIFGSFVRFSCELPPPEKALEGRYLASALSYAYFRSLYPLKGPVHLNCAFREPFFNEAKPSFSSLEKPLLHTPPLITLSPIEFSSIAQKIDQAKQGVIVVGALEEKEAAPILNLAEKLQWPVLADILSNIRSFHPCLITHFDLLLRHHDFKPDFILHLGDRIVSKITSQWIRKSSPETYLLVASHSQPHDPDRCLTERVICQTSLFCEEIEKKIHHKSSSWLKSWRKESDQIAQKIDQILENEPLSEPGLIRFLHHHLPSSFALFLANSMPIRDAEQLFFPHAYKGKIFGKRGLSGIDGNIATAIGIAHGLKRPLLAVLGDLTTLHDINSLAQIKSSTQPVIFLCINNQGGGIFSFLPVSTEEKKETFETFFAATHSFDFKAAADLFHLPYLLLEDFNQLLQAIKEEKSCLIELKTDREKNHQLHLCLHSSMVS